MRTLTQAHAMLKYDVILENSGHDEISVALALVQSLQSLVPHLSVEVHQARRWVRHVPLMVRRGVTHATARDLQAHYAALGAAVAIRPTRSFFPPDCDQMTAWQQEWYSEHLLALHEEALPEWAQAANVSEGYRFSILPSLGADMTMRIWQTAGTLYAAARTSIGHIGPTPGPPEHAIQWSPTKRTWQRLQAALHQHRFWGSKSWNTVPDDLMVLDGVQWVFEGWRHGRYHVLTDETPNEGAAREVGLLLLDMLPAGFAHPDV